MWRSQGKDFPAVGWIRPHQRPGISPSVPVESLIPVFFLVQWSKSLQPHLCCLMLEQAKKWHLWSHFKPLGALLVSVRDKFQYGSFWSWKCVANRNCSKKAGESVCSCPQDTRLASALPFSLSCDLRGLSVGLGFVPFVSWPFDWPGCQWCWTVWGAELRLTKPTSHKDINLLTKPMLLAQAQEEAIFQLQWEVYVSTKSFL